MSAPHETARPSATPSLRARARRATSAAARSTGFAKPTASSTRSATSTRRARWRARRRSTPAANELEHLPLLGVPVAVKDNICTHADADDGVVADPRGLSPALRRDGRRAPRGGGRGHRRQDQLRRVRDGLVDRELRVRRHAQPLGSASGFPAARAADRRRRSPPAWCRSRSARIPADRSASRRRCAA